MAMTKRNFLQDAGKIGLVKLIPMNVDSAIATRLGKERQMNACFIGAGIFGKHTAIRLAAAQSLGLKPTGKSVFGLEAQSVKILHALEAYSLVFLSGSFLDPTFITLRKMILKNWNANKARQYCVMITIIREPSGMPPGDALIPVPNECIVPWLENGHPDDLLHLIMDIYSSLKLPGFVCVDLADFRAVMTEKRCGVMSLSGSTSHRIIDSLKQNCKAGGLLARGEAIYAVFSVNIGIEVSLDELTDMSEVLYGPTGDIKLVWTADTERTIPEGFRATILFSDQASERDNCSKGDVLWHIAGLLGLE